MPFDSPTSARECRERMRQLHSEIKTIEQQLSDPSRVNPKTGKTMRPDQYAKWRKNAAAAIRAKSEEIQFLKSWLQNYRFRIAAGEAGIEGNEQSALLAASLKVLRDIKKRIGHEALTDEELAVIDALARYLDGFSSN